MSAIFTRTSQTLLHTQTWGSVLTIPFHQKDNTIACALEGFSSLEDVFIL